MDNLASVWEGWRAATCMPGGCFCELVRLESAIRQPVNTWSSLAFVVVAVWIAFQRVDSGLRSLQWVFVASALLVGLGSAFYHASLSFLGQFWDVLGMYLLAVPILLYRVARGQSFAFGYAALVGVLALLLWFVPELRRWLFGVVLMGGIWLELRYLRTHPTVSARLFWLALATFAIAFAVWILDNSRVWCAPESALQGHALWHVLGAVATGLLFSHYRNPPPKPKTH